MSKLRNRNSDVSQLARSARETRGISREHLARDVGVSTSTITRFENNGAIPRIGTVLAIAKALDVDLIAAIEGVQA